MKRKTSRRHLIVASIAAMLFFEGCGPGVGGTGTGDAALTAFGATAASVCSGALATELACSPAPAASAAVGAAGSLPVQFVDAAGQVTLDIDGNLATLRASCLRLRFGGEFGLSAGTAEAFFGSYEVDASGIDVLAALSAVPVAGGGALTITLHGVDGQVLIGPLLLRRSPVPLPTPKSC